MSFNRYSIKLSERKPKAKTSFIVFFFVFSTELYLGSCFWSQNKLNDFNFNPISKLMEELSLSNELTLNLKYSFYFALRISQTQLWKIKIKSICFSCSNDLNEKCISAAVLLKEIPLASSFLFWHLACDNISITKKRMNWQMNISSDLMHISGAFKTVIENVF